MSSSTPLNTSNARRVGVVVEQHPSSNPWAESSWHVVAVLPDAPQEDVCKLLARNEVGVKSFYVGSVVVELFKRETADYKVNLSQPVPAVYVVLRPTDDGGEVEVEPFLATCSPYEAESYTIGDEMIVDAVPMPVSLLAWLGLFVEKYHVDEPFQKRKQKDARADALGHGPQGRARPGNDR